MFANSHHATATDSNLYVENPILPPEQLESDDSHEAVRLATFTTRPSPLGTPGGSPSLSKRNLFEFNELSSQDVVEHPVYAKVDFSAKARGNRSADTYEQLTVEGLVWNTAWLDYLVYNMTELFFSIWNPNKSSCVLREFRYVRISL